MYNRRLTKAFQVKLAEANFKPLFVFLCVRVRFFEKEFIHECHQHLLTVVNMPVRFLQKEIVATSSWHNKKTIIKVD